MAKLSFTADKVASTDYVDSHHDNTKQDKLTAGNNITIDEDNVISAVGGSSEMAFDRIPKIKGTFKTGYPRLLKLKNVEASTSDGIMGDDAYEYTPLDDGNYVPKIQAAMLDVAGFIPQRDNKGNLYTGSPIDDLDCTTKKYVDDKISEISGGEPVGVTLLSTTITESTNSIECDIQGCDKIYIYGQFKKATTAGNVTVDAYFDGSQRNVARANNSVSATMSNVTFAFAISFGIPTGSNTYMSYSNCGSYTTSFGATSNVQKTYAGKIPDKITINCSSEFAVNSSISIIGVKSNG